MSFRTSAETPAVSPRCPNSTPFEPCWGPGCCGASLANCRAHVNVDQQSPPAGPELKILKGNYVNFGSLCFLFSLCVCSLCLVGKRRVFCINAKKRNQKMHKQAAAFPQNQSNTFLFEPRWQEKHRNGYRKNFRHLPNEVVAKVVKPPQRTSY